MKTVRDMYARLDEQRRELDALIFSVVGMDNVCGGMDSLDTTTRQAIIKKADEIACAEKNFVLDILGRA